MHFLYQSDSDASSTSDDELPDEGTKRGEPNKFDIHCDGVSNAMALVHTALEEVCILFCILSLPKLNQILTHQKKLMLYYFSN